MSVTPEHDDTGHLASRFGRPAAVVLVLLCGLTLLLGFVNKDRCTGPAFDQWGRTQPDYDERNKEEVCYSDIQHLWIGRDIDRHVFPYVKGSIDDKGNLVGGSVEYPVLSGLLIWAGAIFAGNDAEYLLFSSLLLTPFGLLTGWLLGKLARWRALLWAIGPPLILYAFHNWDLPVALCSVAAVYVVHRWNRPLVERATVASVLLGLGFAFKVYPAAFVLPLMLFVATGGWRGQEMPAGKKVDIAGAVKIALASVITVVLVNLPFAVAGYDGWMASFEFQLLRRVDITTNSIWYWGLRPFMGDDPMQNLVGVVSPIAILVSFAIAAGYGWLRFRREGTYPWIQVSGAMLCGFMLLHKVHSPQYTLWLVPFFVLIRVRLMWVFAYFVADLAMGIGIFRWFWAIEFGQPAGIYDSLSAQAVMVGVWGRAALLVALFVVFLKSRDVTEDDRADFIREGDHRPGTAPGLRRLRSAGAA